VRASGAARPDASTRAIAAFTPSAGGLADPLVLVERRDATGVVADHHVGARFVDCVADLTVDRERARELALRDDVPEAEAATVVPRRVVDHLGT
jgi:hypothetical protein